MISYLGNLIGRRSATVAGAVIEIVCRGESCGTTCTLPCSPVRNDELCSERVKGEHAIVTLQSLAVNVEDRSLKWMPVFPLDASMVL